MTSDAGDRSRRRAARGAEQAASREGFLRKMVIYTVVVTLGLVVLVSVAVVGILMVWSEQLTPGNEGERVLEELEQIRRQGPVPLDDGWTGDDAGR